VSSAGDWTAALTFAMWSLQDPVTCLSPQYPQLREGAQSFQGVAIAIERKTFLLKMFILVIPFRDNKLLFFLSSPSNLSQVLLLNGRVSGLAKPSGSLNVIIIIIIIIMLFI